MSRNLIADDIPCIMGILNARPDSFSDCISDFHEDRDVIQKVLEEKLEKIVNDGANIINDVECTAHFEEMLNVVKDFDVQLIVTHNSRKSKNLSEENDPVGIIINEFEMIYKRL